MTVINEAQQLLRQGRFAEATRAFEKVLRRDPRNVEALNGVAMAMLRSGEPRRALAMLEQAVERDPNRPLSRHNLARAYDACGDLKAAAENYRAALRMRAELYTSRLWLGEVLERLGDARGALVQFARALHDAQAQGRWLNADSTPPGLVPLVEHAVRATEAHRRSLLFGLLDPLRARYGQNELERVTQCLRIYVGDEAASYPDPRQKPSFLFLPGLRPTAYFDKTLIRELPALEASTDAIRAELLAVLQSDAGRERVFGSDALEQQNLRGLREPPSWNGYYFYRHGERRAENCGRCPVTSAALDALPLSRVRAHGPEVLFSVFTPGTHLLPHRGVTNTRIVGHLPLMIPPDCALNVGGEIHAWREGEVVVFDDTYEHEAWNRSDRTRVVLIFDLWNPYMTEAERAAIAEIVAAVGDLRLDIESA
jgi:aspartate beta-hydroxylase